jgi:FtsZ-binding cell division protein ZapB
MSVEQLNALAKKSNWLHETDSEMDVINVHDESNAIHEENKQLMHQRDDWMLKHQALLSKFVPSQGNELDDHSNRCNIADEAFLEYMKENYDLVPLTK